VVVDLARMPHLLVAGTTGSGKSVAVNAMILSLLYKPCRRDVRLIMIDPKMLELSIYEGIPHLLAPVVTDMKEAANALRWCVAEMERRYKLMAAMGVRNIAGFNRKVKEAIEPRASRSPIRCTSPVPDRAGTEAPSPDLEPLPYIVVIIDELADMMMVVGKKVEELIARLAQKARAAGIHLILATQRPSVDVITGLIKANIPTRIAFQVSSKHRLAHHPRPDGRRAAARHGDMLYLPPGTGVPMRIHGAFVADQEVHRVVDTCAIRSPITWRRSSRAMARTAAGRDGLGRTRAATAKSDPLYDQAVRIVTESRPRLGLRHAAPAQDRLQPRRAHGRGHGNGRHRRPPAIQWQPRGAGAAATGLPSAGRPHAAARPGRVSPASAPARARQAAAPGDRGRPPAFDDLLGPAGHRQDHAGAAARPGQRRRVHDPVGGASPGSRTSAPAVEAARAPARAGRPPTVLFVDEVHRFNKAQQDAFLPYRGGRHLTFVGATTENPSFELNNALLSRARVYVLKPLTAEDLRTVIDRALADRERGLGARELDIPEALRDRWRRRPTAMRAAR
jgi:hypothetical protein